MHCKVQPVDAGQARTAATADTARSMRGPRMILTLRKRPRRLALVMLAFALVASHTLAAMGMCIAKLPAPAAVAASDEAACPQHVTDASTHGATSDPAPAAHCPQDDPGAQTRTADLPTTAIDAAPYVVRVSIEAMPHALANASASEGLSPTPLYARLSRLLL